MGCKRSWFWQWRRRSTGCLVDCHSWKSRIVTRYRSGTSRNPEHDSDLGYESSVSGDTTPVTPVNKQGVKLYKALPLGTIGRSLADEFSKDQSCSGQGFDLIIGAIRNHFRSYLEGEPEVQARNGLVPNDEVSERDFCGIHVTNQQQTS